MNWELIQVPPEKVDGVFLYTVVRDSRLLPESVEQAISGFRAMAEDAVVYEIIDSDIGAVATVIISGLIKGESASFDFAAKSKNFDKGYKDDLIKAMQPLWVNLFTGANSLRRITAFVPSSRTRTKRALRVVGFKDEGCLREGIVIKGKDPENLNILGMLADEYVTETGG